MHRYITFALVALVVLTGLAAWHAGWDFAQLETYMRAQGFAGALACAVAFAVSTVLPISALPLLPLAARIYGVWWTVVLATAGWWIGCLAAFVIARWARALLERVTTQEAIRRLETKLPANVGFTQMITLRIVFPGDLVGFALGLLRHVHFPAYALASLIGTIPSAIVFSYAGGELAKGQFMSCALLLAAMLLMSVLLQRLWPEGSRARAR